MLAALDQLTGSAERASEPIDVTPRDGGSTDCRRKSAPTSSSGMRCRPEDEVGALFRLQSVEPPSRGVTSIGSEARSALPVNWSSAASIGLRRLGRRCQHESSVTQLVYRRSVSYTHLRAHETDS